MVERQPCRALRPQGAQLCLGTRHRNLGFGFLLLRLQIILLGRYFFLPQMLFAAVVGLRQLQAFLRTLGFAAPLRHLRAGQYSQHLPSLYALALAHGHTLDHAHHTRGHAHAAIFVQHHLSWQLHGTANLCWGSLQHLYPRFLQLLGAQDHALLVFPLLLPLLGVVFFISVGGCIRMRLQAFFAVVFRILVGDRVCMLA